MSTTVLNRRILIVDDNRAIHEDFRKILVGPEEGELAALESELFGDRPSSVTFELTSAYQGADGVEQVRRARAEGHPFALALVDVRMPPGMDGIQTASRMWQVDPDLQIVLCTAYSGTAWSEIVSRFGTTDRLLILKKPFDPVEVCQLALALTEKWKLAVQARLRLTELTGSRAELARSLALARAVEEASADGILVIAQNQQVSTVNPRFLDMWDVPPELVAERIGPSLLAHVRDQLADPERFDARIAWLHARPGTAGHEELRLRDGRVCELRSGPVRASSGEIHGRLWCWRDVTERRRMDVERAVAAERLAAMGRLAAGVGHEINNPLTFALTNVEALIARCRASSAESDLHRMLEDTLDGLGRIRVIVRDLQTLSRPEEARGAVDLVEVMEQTLQVASAEIRHRAQIIRRYTPAPPVVGERTRIGQVLLNLVVNAAQAIPAGQVANNHIEIRIWPTETHTVLEVHDTGTGIHSSNLERIFDPFFTTKEVGSGTGLGLSVSRELVHRYGGTMSAMSTLGVGSVLRVSLPHADVAPVVIEEVATPRRSSGGKRLLVIDDEPQIGRALELALGDRHQVSVTTEGRAALARIAAGESFDLILCDLMMPDLTGMDVYEELRRGAPALLPRVVFMTGGAYTEKARNFFDKISNERVSKPFSLSEILAVVDRRLAELE